MTDERKHATLKGLASEIVRYLDAFDQPHIVNVARTIRQLVQSPIGDPAPAAAKASGHLPDALAAMDDRPLADAITRAQPYLSWVTYDAYGIDDIGPKFASEHAFASLLGEAAPFTAHDCDAGLFIIGPGIFYRDHHHAAPELYAPLTGPHGWRFVPGGPLRWLAAHNPVWNEPWQPHATLTGDMPFLCIYAWTRDVNIRAKVLAADDWDLHENGS